jgi:hypothetical protein
MAGPLNSNVEPPIHMTPPEYLVVSEFRNDTTQDMTLYLEMTCEEVVRGPGHEIELLARPGPDWLPWTTDYVEGGLQIHSCRVADPDWQFV